MRKIIDYDIVAEESMDKLGEAVRERLMKGYEPLGTIVYLPSYVNELCQVMVMYGEDDNEQ